MITQTGNRHAWLQVQILPNYWSKFCLIKLIFDLHDLFFKKVNAFYRHLFFKPLHLIHQHGKPTATLTVFEEYGDNAKELDDVVA